MNTIKESDSSESRKPWLRKLLLAIPLLFAMFCFWQALPDSVTSPQSAQALTATASIQSERQLETVPIKEIRLGQRTIGRNPDRDDTHPNQPEPVAETWREVHLELAKSDNSLVQIELLRPLAWLNYHQATLNGVIYFVSSLPPKVRTLAKHLRSHWTVENQLHWSLDVTFAEDDSRIHKGNGQEVASLFRRISLSMIKRKKSIKASLRGKRFMAGWNSDLLEDILAGK